VASPLNDGTSVPWEVPFWYHQIVCEAWTLSSHTMRLIELIGSHM
jgi:hypothetical protein